MTARVIGGHPLAAALWACAKLESQPASQLELDLAGLSRIEGELVGLGQDGSAIPEWLSPLLVSIWPGFLVRAAGELEERVCTIGLVDPAQCFASLAGRVAQGACSGLDGEESCAIELDWGLGQGPSFVIEGTESTGLRLPVVYDPDGCEQSTVYRQFLPLGQNMVLVRERGAPEPGRGAESVMAFLEKPVWEALSALP